jgi:hypothetical protein
MSDWMDIDQWRDCAAMERPGIVFELRNAEGQSLFTPCLPHLPAQPFGWASGPVEFRAVAEERPERSGPMPEPVPERSDPMPEPKG